MIYKGLNTYQISFPLGGIGTGSVGLSGSGRLIDWEISGAPNKLGMNGYSHFAIKTEKEERVIDVRVINSDLPPHYIGTSKNSTLHTGFGFGPDPATMAGFPHFKENEFIGEFPIATINFKEQLFNGELSMTAFNPFIPLDDKNSSLPAAFFEFSINNTTNMDLDYTIAFSLQNKAGSERVNHKFKELDKKNYIFMGCDQYDKDDYRYGNMCLATDSEDVSYQEFWYRGGWADGIETFWREFSQSGKLKNRTCNKHLKGNQQSAYDVAVLAPKVHVKSGETGKIRFVMSWHFPNQSKNWDVHYKKVKIEEASVWKNHYGTQFESALQSAEYSLENYDMLFTKTKLFRDTLYASSMPDVAKDAISSNLSTLKTPTTMRLTNGEFYGFEGLLDNYGCCEGSCQHVWNYAYALPFLFPKLERSMRDLEFEYSMRSDGRMSFRLQLPLGAEPADFRACVDGQMGAIIKTYREWKISGDDNWLRKHWSKIKLALEYAWAETNEDRWDPNKTGVITGRQHHTLDMELFGANSWLQGFYLCALKAAAEMAGYLGDTEKYLEYLDLFQKGQKFLEDHLWNGEYYFQNINLSDFSVIEPFKNQICEGGDRTEDVYWNEEVAEIKYQIGEGLIIDQVIGQWHANNCGLGDVFDEGRVQIALKSLMKYNFLASAREFANPWRLFCINDESGMIMCTWPKSSKKPAIPITYNGESMHGFEYQVACHMIQAQLFDEGEKIVKSVRDRYDGEKRNPFNEIECGSNYARSMASYGLLLAYSGFVYDMTKGHIGFYPPKGIDENDKRFLFSVDSAWGYVIINRERLLIHVLWGELPLKSVACPAFFGKTLMLFGNKLECSGDKAIFEKTVITDEEIVIHIL